MPDPARRPIDVRIDTPGREGLTGTTPATVYAPLDDQEQITIAPDGRPMDAQPAWRADFPIDWPQDEYVERRDFMKFLVLTSLAFTAGQFWIALESWSRRGAGRPEMRRVASLDGIPIGGATTFAYPDAHDPCVLVRPSADVLVAYSQKCTHLSCAVRPLVDRGVLQCPCHEGAFELATGRPVAGPPSRPLPTVRLEVRGREIFATGVEDRSV
jgi:nitrite reductase/ring-hydroxylating ferredoxin subunit